MKISTSMGRPLAALLGLALVGASPVAASGSGAAGQPGVGHQAVIGLARADDGAGTVDGVYCTSRANCWAVGETQPAAGSSNRNEILHWNGSAWSHVAVPSPAGLFAVLQAVRCTKASDCWAVGVNRSSASTFLNQVLHWNGRRWRLVRSPQPAGTGSTSFNELNDVVCTSATSCWAVGDYARSRAFDLNQVLHWNGRRWARVHSANPGGVGTGDFNVLTGVRCTSSRACLAVGFDGSLAGAQRNQALRWNGRRWLAIGAPSPGGASADKFSNLLGLACAARTDCWSFGVYGTLRPSRNFLSQMLHWNGTRWSVVAVPEPGGTRSGAMEQLNGGSCHSATDCWAVGSYVPPGGDTLATLNQALHWDGKRWSLVTTPDPGGFADNDVSELRAVRCVSPRNCWAVGDTQTGGGPAHNQILRWNGTSWTAS
jgi:hypothetical protein